MEKKPLCKDCKQNKEKMYSWYATVKTKRGKGIYKYRRYMCKECSKAHLKKWIQTPAGRVSKAKYRKIYRQRQKQNKESLIK